MFREVEIAFGKAVIGAAISRNERFGVTASGAKRPFIRKRDLVSTTNEYKTIRFPTGKEIASLLRRGQGARQGAFAEYWRE